MNINAPGIYAIRCIADGKNTTYVGQSGKKIFTRWLRHKEELRHNKHSNKHLQNAWNLYGESGFEFCILENVDGIEALIDREQYWLDQIRKFVPVYNCGKIARNPMLGEHHTNYARRKMSESHKGKHYSDEHRRNMSKAAMGHPVSEKTRLAVSNGAKNRLPDNAETRMAKGSGFRGKKFTQEHKDRISFSQACPYPSFINEKSGEIISAGIGLNRMCKKMNLNSAKMSEVANGKRRHYRRWTLRDSYD